MLWFFTGFGSTPEATRIADSLQRNSCRGQKSGIALKHVAQHGVHVTLKKHCPPQYFRPCFVARKLSARCQHPFSSSQTQVPLLLTVSFWNKQQTPSKGQIKALRKTTDAGGYYATPKNTAWFETPNVVSSRFLKLTQVTMQHPIVLFITKLQSPLFQNGFKICTLIVRDTTVSLKGFLKTESISV